MALSTAARTVWAKSSPMNSLPIQGWLPLATHLEDAAGIAGRLWDEWLPAAVSRQIAQHAGGDEAGRALLCFAAGVHDVGKATPAFAVQVGTLRDEMVLAGLDMAVGFEPGERRLRPHGLAGAVILVRWLRERYGWVRDESAGIASVVGGHHGVPPSETQVDAARRDDSAVNGKNSRLLGGASWRAVQDELCDHLAERTGAAPYLDGDDWRELPQTVLALVTAVVVVSDWLASNQDLFPLVPVGSERPLRQPDEDGETRVRRAWEAVRLPSPWRANDGADSADELLATRFDLPCNAVARPVQRAAVDAAREMDGPGLLVIEAAMGEGKTEAGMLAAEILAARTGAGGVFVALPTQATSDAMFARVLRWVEGLPVMSVEQASLIADGTAGPDGERRSVYLAHGKAWLNPDFSAVPRSRSASRDMSRDERSPRGAPDAGAYVDAWMTGRRKGVLADFAVGTIDQVLVMALQSRHVALRHLALARKVVILDEIHAFDAYMNTYLERALEWLGSYGVPVVALSATLPSGLRARLVAAYQRGARQIDPPVGGDTASAPEVPVPDGAGSPSSAVVTFTLGQRVVTRSVVGPSRGVSVWIEVADDAVETLLRIVANAVADGGCVLVVRNTVGRAQEAFDALTAEYGQDVELLHSRFLALDRKTREARLVTELGPPPRDGTPGSRPGLRIVVATQVVEQSLDVDFDLLVTDLAPTDVMLQRIGRLHRHERPEGSRPRSLEAARAVVVGVADWETVPPTLDPGGAAVYGKHLLYRAATQVTALAAGTGQIDLPHDIAPLVEEAYGEKQIGPDAWQEAMGDARGRAVAERAASEAAANAFRLRPPATGEGSSLVGWLDASIGDANEGNTAEERGRAQVREGEDTFEVLVVQTDSAGQWRLPDWLPAHLHQGELLTTVGIPTPALRRVLAGCSVRLPGSVCRGRRGDAVLAALEATCVETWQDTPDLAGQLVLVLDEDRRATLPGWEIEYDARAGLKVRKAA